MKAREQETPEPKKRWGYLVRLIGSVICVLLALVGLKFSGEHKLAPRNSGLSGELAQPRVELLLIGSSHTRKSYDMRQLEKSTQVSDSFLITYDGMDLCSIAQVLEYLAAQPAHRPQYVVVEAYSVMLGRVPDIQDPRLFYEAPPQLKLKLVEEYLRDRPLKEALPNVLALAVNRGNDEIVAFPFYLWASRSGSYKGGRADFYFPGMDAEQFKRLQPKLNSETPDARQLAALQHIMDLAQQSGISLIFIDTPMPHPVTADARVQRLKQEFRAAVTAHGHRYVDGDLIFPIDDPAMFTDGNHMSSEGRDMFTRIIAPVLKCWMNSAAGHSCDR